MGHPEHSLNSLLPFLLKDRNRASLAVKCVRREGMTAQLSPRAQGRNVHDTPAQNLQNPLPSLSSFLLFFLSSLLPRPSFLASQRIEIIRNQSPSSRTQGMGLSNTPTSLQVVPKANASVPKGLNMLPHGAWMLVHFSGDGFGLGLEGGEGKYLSPTAFCDPPLHSLPIWQIQTWFSPFERSNKVYSIPPYKPLQEYRVRSCYYLLECVEMADPFELGPRPVGSE